jgi:hypothetical protein
MSAAPPEKSATSTPCSAPVRCMAASSRVNEVCRLISHADSAKVTDNLWGESLATPVAKRLKQDIRETTGLTASAGVAPNKFLAKVASGWHKPDGLTVISPGRVEAFLQQLPVDALWGVGPVTAAKLRKIGVARLVEVRAGKPLAAYLLEGDPYLSGRAARELAAALVPEAQRLAGGSIKHDISVPVASVPGFIRTASLWVSEHVPEALLL